MAEALPPDCPLCRRLATLDRESDPDVVWQFPHSVVLLGQWQFYHGYCIVVARRHVRELHHLTDPERWQYFEGMSMTAKAIDLAFRPHKLNYELLGNQVPHLHWHIFPRSATDPDVLKPVWLALERAEREATHKEQMTVGPVDRKETIAILRKQLQELTGQLL